AVIGGEAITPTGLANIAAIDPKSLPEIAPCRIGACVAGTGKFICICLNYSDHSAETGATVPPDDCGCCFHEDDRLGRHG
ncbi:hypothetical protein ACC703_39540, partial [Rhizobium ruizarguesonis]